MYLVNNTNIIKIFLLAFLFIACSEKNENVETSQILDIKFEKEGEAELYVGDSTIKKLELEFATTNNQRSQGLMYRDSLADNQAMLFIHPDDQIGKLTYWMKNTRIPLDIIYFSPDSTIVSIAKNAQPYQEQGVPSATEDAKFVLEIAGGLSDEWNLEPKKTKLRWKSND